MESIYRLLRDPTWWFTAVVIGIIASLSASYLRDGISMVAAKVSEGWANRRALRLSKDDRHVRMLAAHPHLLTLEGIHICAHFLMIMFLFMVMAVLFSILQVEAIAEGLRKTESVTPLTIAAWMILAIFYFCMVRALYSFFPRLNILTRARTLYVRSLPTTVFEAPKGTEVVSSE